MNKHYASTKICEVRKAKAMHDFKDLSVVPKFWKVFKGF